MTLRTIVVVVGTAAFSRVSLRRGCEDNTDKLNSLMRYIADKFIFHFSMEMRI